MGERRIPPDIRGDEPKCLAGAVLWYKVDPDDTRINPTYQQEELKGKVWKDGRLEWCGTGLGRVSLPARSKVTFTTTVPSGDWDAFRLGLRWCPRPDRKGPWSTAWSEAVERKTIQGK